MKYNELFYESATLGVSNPISDFSKPIEESILADLKVSDVRAIYPLIRAINSGRLTRNFTYYPKEALIGNQDPAEPTGFSSFVKPYGKPILREHKSSASFNGDADIPMGRIVYAGYKEHKDIEPISPKNKYFPGTVEGDGALFLVPAITHPESITRVLGRSDQTVSIGARVDSVTEAISNKDIAQLSREGKELPPYEKGQIYNNKLSYWSMGPIKGIECSFVNVPSDEYAGVVDPDIGVEGIRLMVGQKKQGVKEFNFYDAKTEQEIKLDLDFSEYDDSYFVDSNKSHNIWWLNKELKESTHQESVSEEIMKLEINKEHLLNFEELSKLKDQENFLEELEAITKTQELEDELLAVRQELLNENVTFVPSNMEKFQELQDKYVDLIGKWDETSATLVTLAFINEGETFNKPEPKEDPNKLLTFGELYNLDSEDEDFAKEAKLSTDARNKLPESSFCGPNRSFPVHDKCLAGSTKISLLDGRTVKIEDMETMLANGEELWVYGYSLGQKAIVPAKVSKAWMTIKNSPTLKITLDNGEVVECTRNHPFLLRNGEYKRADELAIGESLMPLYSQLSAGRSNSTAVYQEIYQPHYGFWEKTHRMVIREIEGPREDKSIITHHIDENKTNNSPNNLKYMTREDHMNLHSQNFEKAPRLFSELEKQARSKFMKEKMNRVLNDSSMSKIHSDKISKGRRTYDWSDPTNVLPNTSFNLHEAASLISSGIPIRWIAATAGVNDKTIIRWLRGANLNYTSYSRGKSPKYISILKTYFNEVFHQNIDDLYQEYLSGTSFASLQKKYKIDRETLKNWFVKVQLETDRKKLSCPDVFLPFNHKIVSIERGRDCDVYDIEVPATSNFALSAGVFVHNSHALAALRLVGRYKGEDKEEVKACIHRKAQKYGVGIKGESITLFPLVVEYFVNKEQHIYTPIKISSVEEADSILSNLKDIAVSYSLDESQAEDLKKFVEESKEILTNPLFENESEIIPVSLSTEFFINYFEQTENSNYHKYLAGFVGLIRKNKIDKQTVEAAIESYNIFGNSILKKWAEEIPVAVEKEVEQTESIPSVETIPDLTAATAETQEGNQKHVESSKRPWYSGLDLGTKKSSKVKIKEKGV